MTQRAVLLVNLGSPDQPDTPSVRRYLNQFLMDPYVIQLPWLLRRFIVSAFVLPSRPKASAEAYRSVWTDTGSPLIVLSEKLHKAVQQQVDMPVELAMRYGNPSIEAGLLKLARIDGVKEIFFVPLYPHFADSTVTTCIEMAKQVIAKHKLDIVLTIKPPFYQEEGYINALVEQTRPYLMEEHDHLLFSYHGLPESHILKRDPSGQHCLQQADCCNKPHVAHATCYRHQVMTTTAAFAQKARLNPDNYSVAFQSRLGRAKWLGPNTEDRLIELAQNGTKNVLVMCPAFVTDCLETLEEIAIRAEEVFIEAGGRSLKLIPCLNDDPVWVNLLAQWCETS